MPEPILTMDADDDLPRTIRRERDAKQAREREAREREAQAQARERLSPGPDPMHFFQQPAAYSFAAPAGSAAATLDVPFSRLMAFFFKAVFAAIPALIVLGALLWLAGHGLQTFFPGLVKLKVLVYMPS